MGNFILICTGLTVSFGIYSIIRFFKTKFDLKGKFQDMNGKIALVTGANTGIGKEIAKGLAERGALVILACRDMKKACTAAEEIQNFTKNPDVIPMELDLAKFESIKQFVTEFKKNHKELHVLVNNAGVFFIPHSLTSDGFETVFQVNYLGHFLLTCELLDMLRRSNPSRIINVTSHGHKMCSEIDFKDINGLNNYKKFGAYSQSKLAQIFFTQSLSKLLKGTGVTAYAANPGNVKSEIFRNFFLVSNPILAFIQWPIFWFIFKTPQEGAQTPLYCTVSSDIEELTGRYFSDCKETTPSSTLLNTQMEMELWRRSLQYVGIQNSDLCLEQDKE